MSEAAVGAVGAVGVSTEEGTGIMTELEKQRRAKIKEEEEQQALLERAIPTPAGYHILIALPRVDETFGESGLVKSSKTIRDEYILSTIGLVVDIGEQAYRDPERFPTGPWCKKGDYVLFRANSGTRFKIGKQEFRLLNDDSVQAIVPDPRAVERAV